MTEDKPMKSKEKKIIEAIERQAYYDNMSIQEKIDKLNKGKYIAKKEREKLGRKIMQQKGGECKINNRREVNTMRKY